MEFMENERRMIERKSSNESLISQITRVEDKSEKEFFRLLFLSIVLNYPKMVVDSLLEKDVNEMYYRAKKIYKLKFN
jgi:hypothetical protein